MTLWEQLHKSALETKQKKKKEVTEASEHLNQSTGCQFMINLAALEHLVAALQKQAEVRRLTLSQ